MLDQTQMVRFFQKRLNEENQIFIVDNSIFQVHNFSLQLWQRLGSMENTFVLVSLFRVVRQSKHENLFLGNI